MDEMQETEVTLSTGKLLGIFFGAAIICGIFFSFGYAVGKNSTPAAGVAIMDSSSLSTVATNGGAKPGASRPADTNTQAADQGTTPDTPKTAESQKTTAPELTAKAESPKPIPASTAAGAGFTVQVAAVSKMEDAEALKAALEKKQYPVFIVDNDESHLFHVQVGPFPDQKDAEAMKNKLAADGYNAILKR
jgi:cell division septation protein DedD